MCFPQVYFPPWDFVNQYKQEDERYVNWELVFFEYNLSQASVKIDCSIMNLKRCYLGDVNWNIVP